MPSSIIIAAVAAVVSVATGTGIALAAASFVASVVLGGVSRALSKKPKASSNDSVSANARDRTLTVRQPTAPWTVIYGQARVGGTYAFIATSPQGELQNGFLHAVIVLAGHEVEEIGDILFDDTVVPLSASGAGYVANSGTYVNDSNQSYVYIEKYLGTENQGASTYLSSLNLGWTSNHRLRGRAYIYVQLQFNADKFPNGVPNITAIVKGRKCFDPRGSVTQWTKNPALIIADYITNPDFGLGADISEIDLTTLTAEANVCDETVALADGSAELRYTAHGTFTTDKTPKSIIEELLTAMAGRLVYAGGQWKIYAGAYRTPTVTLDEGDLRAGLSIRTRVSRRENFNAVKGVYVSIPNGWQPTDFPAVTSSTYEAEDNGERVYKDIDLPYTISAATAQRLAKIELMRARQQISVTMPCTMMAYQLQVPDAVMVNNTRMGWASKVFEVVNSTLVVENDDKDVPYLAVNLDLRETSSLVYSWSTTEQQAEAVARNTNLRNPFLTQAPGIPTVTEELFETIESSGVRVRTIVEWAAPPDSFIEHYEVKYAPAGTTTYTTLPVTRALSIGILDLAPGTYDFYVKAISDLKVSSAYVTTRKEILGLGATPSDVTGLTMVAMSGIAFLQWTRHVDLDVRRGGYFRFRWTPITASATWDSAIDIGDVVDGNATQVYLPLVSGTYLVKAVDSSGNYSANATTVMTNAPSPFTYSNLGTISEGTSFPGTKSNVAVSAGRLMLTGSATFDSIASLDAVDNLDTDGGIADMGTYNFNSGFDGTTTRKMRLTANVGASVINQLDQFDSRGASVDDWENWDGTITSSAGVRMEMRTTDNAPGTAATWSSWNRFAVADVNCRAVQFRSVLFTDDRAYNVSVGTLAVSVDTLSA